jgi:hypothetical protein
LTRKETLLTNHVTRFGGAPPGFSSRRPRVREDAYWKVRDERARGRLGGKTKGRSVRGFFGRGESTSSFILAER